MDAAVEVKRELEEMKKLGMRVPQRAIDFCTTNADEVRKDYESGMSISEIADMIRDLN